MLPQGRPQLADIPRINAYQPIAPISSPRKVDAADDRRSHDSPEQARKEDSFELHDADVEADEGEDSHLLHKGSSGEDSRLDISL